MASVQGSWKQVSSSLRAWGLYMEAAWPGVSHFPLREQRLVQWSSFFQNPETFRRYVSGVRWGARLHGDPDLSDSRQVAAALRAGRTLHVVRPRALLLSRHVRTICSAAVLDGDPRDASHGDALCLDDTAYIAFRETVRSASWQSEFLSQSLGVRRSIARNIRNQSEARKQTDSAYADVDSQAAIKILMQTGATTLIHGHTHRPANHWLGPAHQRIVLSDWDLSASPPRAEVLRLSAGEQGKPATAQRISSLSAAPNPAG